MATKDNIFPRNLRDFSTVAMAPHHLPARLFPAVEDSSELSVACLRTDFLASRIAAAVEGAEAHLLNMNVTSEVLDSGEILVDLRVSHRNAGAVARSLERYGFRVVDMRGALDDDPDATLSERVGELLAHLNV